MVKSDNFEAGAATMPAYGNKDRQRVKHSQLTLTDTAEALGVSTATVRNWVKSGKITKAAAADRPARFDKEEILALKQQIDSGQLNRLRSRRNKKAVQGHHIPQEYVSYQPYVALAAQVLELAGAVQGPQQIRFILGEITLKLLHSKGSITAADCKESLCEQFLAGELTWSYGSALRELLGGAQAINEKNAAILRSINHLHIPYVAGEDFLGLVYLSLTGLGMRKHSGAYYTPSAIVTSLTANSLSLLPDADIPAAIDPCCGTGNFLLKLFSQLKSRLLDTGYRVQAAEKILIDKIHGIDCDPIAAAAAKINLLLSLESEAIECAPHILCENTLASCSSRPDAKQYRLAIGNPPWGLNFTRSDREMYRDMYQTAQGSPESFNLFLERGLSMLTPDGLLSYVLPQSFLNVKMHAPARDLILTTAAIENITLLGNKFSRVFAPAITISLRKTNRKVPNQTITVATTSGSYQVSQSRLLDNEHRVFNITASDNEQRIIRRMNSLPDSALLAGSADFALGIVTGNNKKFVTARKPAGGEVILKGSNIYKYNYYPGSSYIIFTPEQFQQVAPVSLYRAGEKLFYRFINEHLTFAYDAGGTLSLNSANIVIPKLAGHRCKYVLAVLNSRPAQFFFTHSFLSVKILRQHIEAVPIPLCPAGEQELIVSLVDRLMNTEKPHDRSELYELIDRHIMDLYCLDKATQQYIRAKLPRPMYLSR